MVAFTALMATLVVKFCIFLSADTRLYQAFVIGLLLLAEAAPRQLVSAIPADAMAADLR